MSQKPWCIGKLLLFAAVVLSGSFSCLAAIVTPIPLNGAGTVEERGKPGTQVAITWTTNSGVPLGTTPILIIPAGGVLRIPVPAMSPNANGNLRRVYDYVQFSKDPGQVNYLSTEALVPSGGDFIQYTFLDFILMSLGPAGSVAVPDLYADTNQDGVLDEGDVLYSAVNLAAYIPAMPSFNLGDTFTITNGTSLLLPGMLFGTQPITIDPTSLDGFSNPAPFTGVGTALTEHVNVVTPEPSLAGLVAMACLALIVVKTRQLPIGAARVRPVLFPPSR
jgi:hypothetical protein